MANKKSTHPTGIVSVCSSHPIVLRTCIKEAKKHNFPILIESTCNQVNQFGGYTGMRPVDFVGHVRKLAKECDLPDDFLFLGGDHLGPSVWKDLPSKIAMDNSTQMVRQYVRAGYKKIHFDASMNCADDSFPLPTEVISDREAELCTAALEECEASGIDLASMCFVVGTEVPTPGGTADADEHITVSNVEETKENIDHTRKTFFKHGLERAWQQTFAFVVQSGVEFGNSNIQPYDRNKAKGLSDLIEAYDNIIFEAHSTDYQLRMHLREMVEDHFAILKVGPALTFALREAIMSLESIEKELLSGSSVSLSNFRRILDQVMCAKPKYWRKHYSADHNVAAFQRKYSLLDRSRYYWVHKDIESALRRLINNLSSCKIPISILSQHMPKQYMKVRMGEIPNSPGELIHDKIVDIFKDYIYATGTQTKN